MNGTSRSGSTHTCVDSQGQPIAGASLYVTDRDGFPLTLYADWEGDLTLPNPLTTDETGKAPFWVDVSGAQLDGVIEVTAPGCASTRVPVIFLPLREGAFIGMDQRLA